MVDTHTHSIPNRTRNLEVAFLICAGPFFWFVARVFVGCKSLDVAQKFMIAEFDPTSHYIFFTTQRILHILTPWDGKHRRSSA